MSDLCFRWATRSFWVWLWCRRWWDTGSRVSWRQPWTEDSWTQFIQWGLRTNILNRSKKRRLLLVKQNEWNTVSLSISVFWFVCFWLKLWAGINNQVHRDTPVSADRWSSFLLLKVPFQILVNISATLIILGLSSRVFLLFKKASVLNGLDMFRTVCSSLVVLKWAFGTIFVRLVHQWFHERWTMVSLSSAAAWQQNL